MGVENDEAFANWRSTRQSLKSAYGKLPARSLEVHCIPVREEEWGERMPESKLMYVTGTKQFTLIVDLEVTTEANVCAGSSTDHGTLFGLKEVTQVKVLNHNADSDWLLWSWPWPTRHCSGRVGPMLASTVSPTASGPNATLTWFRSSAATILPVRILAWK